MSQTRTYIFFKSLNPKTFAQEPLLDVASIIDVWLFRSCFSPWSFFSKCLVFLFNFDYTWQVYILERIFKGHFFVKIGCRQGTLGRELLIICGIPREADN